MKFFDLPPLLTDHCDLLAISRLITAHQIQQTSAAVLVDKIQPHTACLSAKSRDFIRTKRPCCWSSQLSIISFVAFSYLISLAVPPIASTVTRFLLVLVTLSLGPINVRLTLYIPGLG